MPTHRHSVTVDLRALKSRGKVFKLVTTMIRTGVIHEHGFLAQKGLTDDRFKDWAVIVRFKSSRNRSEFYDGIKRVLHPEIFNRIGLRFTRPIKARSEPIKYLRAS